MNPVTPLKRGYGVTIRRSNGVKEEEIKIIVRDGKTISLKDLFEGKKKTRKKMANLSFEKKINMLISLQETAHSWGEMEDVFIWKL